MMEKELEPHLEKLKDLLDSCNVDAYEIYSLGKDQRKLEVRNGDLESSEESKSKAISIRLLKDKKISFSYTSDLSEPALQEMIQSCMSALKYLDSDDDFDFFRATNSEEYSYPKIRYAEKIKTQDAFDLTVGMERSARNFDSRIQAVRGASFKESEYQVRLVNSYGLDLSYQENTKHLGITVVAEDKQGAESGDEFQYSHSFSDLNAQFVAESAAKKALSYLGAKSPKTQICPMIMSSEVVSEVLSLILESFRADFIFKDRSFLKGKLNEKIYSNHLNLVEDPFDPKAISQIFFDDEGAPKKKLDLIQAGSIKNFLSDSYHQKKLALDHCGAASREQGVKSQPSISYSNIVVQPGSYTLEDLQKEMGNGVFITEVLGMHMVNPVSGDFSVGAAGFAISHGKVTHAIKNMAIAHNIHDLFNEIEYLGNDLRYYYDIAAVSMLFKKISVSGT